MERSTDSLPNAWIVIPARGGSVGIPRKNVRLLGGKPLISYAIMTALQVLPADRVLVITDDAEIARVADNEGASVILEQVLTPADETLDTKILRNFPELRLRGAQDHDLVITVQPTSPLLKSETLREVWRKFESDETVASVLSVADDRHLRWKIDDSGAAAPAFDKRVNRQQLPAEFRETGGVIAARLADIEREGSRVIAPVSVIALGEDEALDIDNYADLYAAAHLLSRRRIAVRVDASREIGMGHVYRVLALASELARHELKIFLSSKMELGQRFFAEYPYIVELVDDHEDFCAQLSEFDPDLVVLDVLDTDASDIRAIRKAAERTKIVTFEDRGNGAAEADLLVAEFIDNPEVPGHRKVAGIDYALLSPAFEYRVTEQDGRRMEEVRNVLLLFGGTDPSGLAGRSVNILAQVGYANKVTLVRGLGASPLDFREEDLPFELELLEHVTNMPALMENADLAFTSAGRTVVELLSRGVPSICLAQNSKEMTHTHAVKENGVLPLGLGTDVDEDVFADATRGMLWDPQLRSEYASRAAAAGARRSNRKTIKAILDKVGFTDFPDI